MRKTLAKGLALAVLSTALAAGSAWATPTDFSFSGNYTLSDTGGTAAYDSLAFTAIFSHGSGTVTAYHPGNDALFDDPGFEYITINDNNPLTLDESNPYHFTPTTYPGGFALYDDDDTLLMQADLEAELLEISSAGGQINSAFYANLYNISAGSSYVSGSSEIVDSFLNGYNPGGAMTITLQFAGDLAGLIDGGGEPYDGSYSGTAAPVPEPATMLLLGSGIAGLAGAGRKRMKKA